MANLTAINRKLLEDLLNMSSGFVLDFTNASFEAFFRDYDIEIYSKEYDRYGDSKAKRMRAYWEVTDDETAGRVLQGLLNYIVALKPDEAGQVTERHCAIVSRLTGATPARASTNIAEDQFLKQQFGEIDYDGLDLSKPLEHVVQQRLDEIWRALEHDLPLAAVFLSGSTLEGLLLDKANADPETFNRAKSAPRKDGKVKGFRDWTLSDLINVACDVGVISVDVKKYSHALRDFRNYIHPHEQATSGFDPNIHTAEISWQVLRAAIADLTDAR